MSKPDIMKQDLYGILGVPEEATSKEIVRAYRKNALKCHPDKNPDNPKAVELFHQLSEALAVLTDVPARAAYEKILKAKKAAEIRHRQLDAKRKKFKEDLEARELAAQSRKDVDSKAEKNLEAEIKRLRKEGSALLKAEQDYLNTQVHSNTTVEEDSPKSSHTTPKLKLKWKTKKGDGSNGGYSTQNLQTMFNKYGEVLNVLVSSKRVGSAIIELRDSHSAILAVQNEIGLPENPLTLAWLEGQPAKTAEKNDQVPPNVNPSADPYNSVHNPNQQVFSPNSHDFESLVLRRLRQAEERKRLAEEMAREGDADET